MMQGALDFLTGESYVAELLRNQFVFKVIPMLNPDGVINGNYRCSLIGVDLNRRWKHPNKSIHPIIFQAKRLIKVFASTFKLDLICDMHGHSRKHNIFMYGNNVKSDPSACRLFPFILSKISPNFYFPYCKFTATKSKEATLRMALFKDLKIPCVYTLESSFLGADTVHFIQGRHKGTHFTTESFMDMGRELCMAVLIAFGRDGCLPLPRSMSKSGMRRSGGRFSLSTDKSTQISIEKYAQVTRAGALQELLSDDRLLTGGEADSSSGSDSEPSLDNIPQLTDQPVAPSRSTSRLVLKLPTTKQPTLPKTKRCLECGLELTMGHVCPLRINPVNETKTQTMVGLKTYYTVHGKRVHDQVTQTRVSFYFRYKINKEKAEKTGVAEISRPQIVVLEPEPTPEPVSDPTTAVDISLSKKTRRRSRMSLGSSLNEGRFIPVSETQSTFPGVLEEVEKLKTSSRYQKPAK